MDMTARQRTLTALFILLLGAVATGTVVPSAAGIIMAGAFLASRSWAAKPEPEPIDQDA